MRMIQLITILRWCQRTAQSMRANSCRFGQKQRMMEENCEVNGRLLQGLRYSTKGIKVDKNDSSNYTALEVRLISSIEDQDQPLTSLDDSFSP